MALDNRLYMDEDEFAFYRGNLKHIQERYDKFKTDYGDGLGEKAIEAKNDWAMFIIRLLGRRIDDIINAERMSANEHDKNDYRQNARDQILDNILKYDPYFSSEAGTGGILPITFFEKFIRQMFRTHYTTKNGTPKAVTLTAISQNIQYINKALAQMYDEQGDPMYPEGINTPGLGPETICAICGSVRINGQKVKPMSLTTIKNAMEYERFGSAASLDSMKDDDKNFEVAGLGVSPMDKVIGDMNAEKIKSAIAKLNPFQLMIIHMAHGIETKQRNPHQICTFLNLPENNKLYEEYKEWWPRKRHITESDVSMAYNRGREILASQPEIYKTWPSVVKHVDVIVEDEQISADDLLDSLKKKDDDDDDEL